MGFKVKKRRKSSRFRGSQTAHRGAKERTRGSGNRGGKGMAGTGKRGDQKKTLVIKLTGGNNYFGKSRTLRRGTYPKKLETINVSDIEQRLPSLLEMKSAKESGKDAYEINLEGYKVLGDGEFTLKATITASAASQSAIDKIKAAKGTLTLLKETVAERRSVEKEEKKEKTYLKK